MEENAGTIMICESCGQRLNVPCSLKRIEIGCPRCRAAGIVLPYEIVPLTQRTPEWHEWRDHGLGASDAPVILRENPWKSPASLLKEKINGTRTGQTWAMARGAALEPEAIDRYERRFGLRVLPVCVQSRKYPWLRASLDGLAADGSRVVEVKCGDKVYEHTKSSNNPPSYYYGQLQHILAVTGLGRIDFWCYLPRRPELHICVDRNDDYITRMVEEEYKFWCSLSQ